jgi:transcriptional regulator with GAF, ATPase, and Fis domain/CHASE1-domain containing sensor protein
MPKTASKAHTDNPDPERSTSQAPPLPKHAFINAMLRFSFRKGGSPWSILIVGIFVTLLVSLYVKYEVDATAEREFDHQCREIKGVIWDRLDAQARFLKSTAAFFEAADTVTLKKWVVFTRFQAIEKELNGVLGVGFSLLIPPAELDQHIRNMRREGFPKYRVTPEGARDAYTSVIYIEPLSGPNQRVFGFDMLSEPARRLAMERARDAGTAMLTGKVALLQDAGNGGQAGTLMYMPVYRKGMQIVSVEQRRAAIYGWVFNPLRMNNLVHGILKDASLEEAQKLHFQIYDGATATSRDLLYECQSASANHSGDQVLFRRLVPFEYNGHRWTFSFTKTGGGFLSTDYHDVWMLVVGGVAVNLLLFFLVRALLITRAETLGLAESLTSELQSSEQFTSDIINSLPLRIAVLDTDGVIVSVNEGWLNDARENNCSSVGKVGERHLDPCRDIICGRGGEGFNDVCKGLQKVLSGELEKYSMEYSCHSVQTPRWFLMNATRLSGNRHGIVVSHLDITARVLAEMGLAEFLAQLDRLVVERTEELTRANAQLHLEITEREKAEESLRAAYMEISGLKDRLQAENVYLEKEVAQRHNFGDFIGKSRRLGSLFDQIFQVAPMNATVLVLGETGTGKGVVARAIHSQSARKDRPMITVNCTALPSNLIESELFGREKGAFTGSNARQIGRFDLANGGTIFLDEIGDLALELQSKLLRVIQDGEFEMVGSPRTIKVDVRIIAATNRNLEEEIRKGNFREDLFYRLNVFPLNVPPLRERKDDIPLLVNHFVAKFNKKNGKSIETVSADLLKNMQDYRWPGNVRELESYIERAVIISQGTTLQVTDRLEIVSEADVPRKGEVKAITELEREHILQVLQQTNWRINGDKGAAVLLGINPSTLRARIKKLGITR